MSRLVKWLGRVCTFRFVFVVLGGVLLVLWYKVLNHADLFLLQHNNQLLDPFHSELWPADLTDTTRGSAGPGLDEGAGNPVLPADAAGRASRDPGGSALNASAVIPHQAALRQELQSALQWRADEKDTIVVSIVDEGAVPFALNFIETSVERLHLRNYLPLCVDEVAQAAVEATGYDCLLYRVPLNGTATASDFGTEDYFRKTNLKTWVVLEVLRLGYSVLMADVDVVLFRNPFPHFTCYECDIHVQMDSEMYNSGFVFVRPTPASMDVYQKAWEAYLFYHKAHDQAYLNVALRQAVKAGDAKVMELSRDLFVCGLYYFEHDFRTFYNRPPCVDCVMAHNNYIGSNAAKVYRFKENVLWLQDQGEYYSSDARRYLTYENPYDFGAGRTIDMERRALLNGLVLAHVTNRTLILPSFRCCACDERRCDDPKHRCSLLSVLRVKTFDQYFAGIYREHSFLQHPKISRRVVHSQSPLISLNSTWRLPTFANVTNLVREDKIREWRVFPANSTEARLSLDHLTPWLKQFDSYSVLRFMHLYGAMDFANVKDVEGRQLFETYKLGIACTNYQQWSPEVRSKII